MVLSETDLNKSSILTHNYEKQSTKPDRIVKQSDRTSGPQFLGGTSAAILLGSGLTNRQTDGSIVEIIPESQTKAMWNTASHSETTNQQASFVRVTHVKLCSDTLLQGIQHGNTNAITYFLFTQLGKLQVLNMRGYCSHISFTDNSSAQPLSQPILTINRAFRSQELASLSTLLS